MQKVFKMILKIKIIVVQIYKFLSGSLYYNTYLLFIYYSRALITRFINNLFKEIPHKKAFLLLPHVDFYCF